MITTQSIKSPSITDVEILVPLEGWFANEAIVRFPSNKESYNFASRKTKHVIISVYTIMTHAGSNYINISSTCRANFLREGPLLRHEASFPAKANARTRKHIALQPDTIQT